MLLNCVLSVFTKVHFSLFSCAGPWLLSVDRQEVQDLGDNLWNKDLVERLPCLIVNIFRWAASERLSTKRQYSAIGKLLPVLSQGSSASLLTTEFLGQSVSLSVLARALYTERVLPVALSKEGKGETSTSADAAVDKMDVDEPVPHQARTGYYEGKHSVWVPPSFLSYLSPGFLYGWLGKRPLRTDFLGDAAYHPLFASPNIIEQMNDGLLQNRGDQLSREIGAGAGKQLNDDAVQKLVSLMAAIGAAYADHPLIEQTDHAKSMTEKWNPVPPNSTDNTQRLTLPSIGAWPVFLTADGVLSTLAQVVLPDESFANAPQKLRCTLRPYMLGSKAEDSRRTDDGWAPLGRSGTKRDFRGNGKQSNKQSNKRGRGGSRSPPPQSPQKKLLHPLLETAIFGLESSSTPSSAGDDLTTHARHFIARARAEAASTNTISVSSAASNLLAAYAKSSTELSSEQVATVLEITEYALLICEASLISHVIIERPPTNKPCLIPTQKAYIGRALDEAGRGGDLETFSKGSLRFVSSAYTSIAAERQKLLKLFDEAGVQSGLSAEVTAIVDVNKADKHLFTNEILPKLPDKKLPQTRKSTAKGIIYLPYDLDVPVDKRKFYLLDSQIPREWEKIVREMSPSCAVGFVSLLLGMSFDTATKEVNTKTTPAAAAFLSGSVQGNADKKDAGNEGPGCGRKSTRIGKGTAVPLRRRLCFLPPGQVRNKVNFKTNMWYRFDSTYLFALSAPFLSILSYHNAAGRKIHRCFRSRVCSAAVEVEVGAMCDAIAILCQGKR